LQKQLQAESQVALQEQSSELQSKIQELEVNRSEAEQALRKFKKEQKEILRETEKKHTEMMNELELHHIESITQLKEEHNKQVVESATNARGDVAKIKDAQLKSLEEKSSREKIQLQKNLQMESEKIAAIQQALENAQEEHTQEIERCKQWAKVQMDQERENLELGQHESCNVFRAQISLLQLENHDLRSQIEHRAGGQHSKQENINLPDHYRAGSFEDLNDLHQSGLDIKSGSAPGPTTMNQIEETLTAETKTALQEPKVRRLKDLATMLEPSNSKDLGALGTPKASNQQLPENLEQYSHFPSSGSKVAEVLLPDNPFFVPRARGSNQEETENGRFVNSNCRPDAIPFNIYNPHHDVIRSSAPPSTSGSMESVSVLAKKVVASQLPQSQHQQKPLKSGTSPSQQASEMGKGKRRTGPRGSRSQGYEHNHSSLQIGAELIVVPSNDRHKLATNVSARGMKRAAADIDHHEHISKKSEPPISRERTYRVALNDISQTRHQSNRMASRPNDFQIVGTPHTGQFRYNRPPTARPTTAKSTSSRSGPRRVLKRSEFTMVARFDQELSR
jgi:myosin heavy subunit